MTVIGVIKDCAYRSPSKDLPHTVFVNTNKSQWMWPRCFVLFKYKPGTWEECRRSIEEMQQAELPDRKLFLRKNDIISICNQKMHYPVYWDSLQLFVS